MLLLKMAKTKVRKKTGADGLFSNLVVVLKDWGLEINKYKLSIIMPCRRNALSLKQICISVTACNFERLWAQHFDRQFGDTPRLLHIIGPFNDLPGQLCEDILQALLNLRMLRKSHLQLLLVPQIKHINFAAAYINSVSTPALDILALRCKNLVSLNLTNCGSLSSVTISQCLSVLPFLQTLILKQTKINDQVMKVIATYLSCLIHLDIHACPVTDKGAHFLCGDGGDFHPVCVNLVLLDISATKIHVAGCSVIIQCYTKLRCLSHPDSVEAVACLHKQVSSSKHDLKSREADTSAGTSVSEGVGCHTSDHHRLEILYATALRCQRIEPESMRLACHHCPSVREVHWYQDATDKLLQLLGCLQHLSVLEVTSSKPHDVTFHNGILPLLKTHGQQMLSLGLYDIEDMDLGLLGWYCPKLERLKLVSMHEQADFSHSYISSKEQAACFRQLQQLTLVFSEGSMRLDHHNLELMLVNASNLQELHFIEVHCFTDDVFIAALLAHGFPYLKQVQLESCNQITLVSLIQLLTSTNPLTQLTLKRCHLVTFQDFQELNNLVLSEGVVLNLEWD